MHQYRQTNEHCMYQLSAESAWNVEKPKQENGK